MSILIKGQTSSLYLTKPIEIPDVEIMRFSDPYIADWNNDGKKDFIIGSGSGEISPLLTKGPIRAASIWQ